MAAAVRLPGEVFARELEALGVTPTELARHLRAPANSMTQVVNGKRAITGDSALRLPAPGINEAFSRHVR